MKIGKLEYFGGLFEKIDLATSDKANVHIQYEGPEIPKSVIQSFANERIEELRGEHGLPGVGGPEQIDCLKVEAGGESWETYVINRAIQCHGSCGARPMLHCAQLVSKPFGSKTD